MRRGYYGWNEAELPKAALQARRDRLRAAMREAGLDGLAFYTNIARPAAVAWLTGFTPYWSEGLLYLPRDGEPQFATALSKRVAEWMHSVTPDANIVNTPKPAEQVAKQLAAGKKRLGVLELEQFPGGQADEMLAAAPRLDLVDATALFQAARLQRDDAERGLFAHAAVIAKEAFVAIDASPIRDAHRLVGAVEKSARIARAEDAQITLAPDLATGASFLRVDRAERVGACFAIRASIAYKSTWTRRTRSIATEASIAPRFAALEAAFDALVARRDAAKPLASQVAAAIGGVQGARLEHWLLEDCRGSYPLESVVGDALADAVASSCSVLTAHATVDGVNWVATRPI